MFGGSAAHVNFVCDQKSVPISVWIKKKIQSMVPVSIVISSKKKNHFLGIFLAFGQQVAIWGEAWGAGGP